ncbi:NADH-quinone oxidoreductase subunit M [Pectinatus haikarae]|uniref:NADH-quinone oxidoreductase subunit M n=2 Tax=Pectinatus haikarae TaxID=349096 RepID=A0ABT9Y8Z3_9FIRM|nr:NADH-quinone oxidoreductase subunit M [Pectinatus haikarae]
MSTILLMPVLAIFLLFFVPPSSEKTIKIISATAMLISFLLTVYVYISYDNSAGGLQFTEKIPWISDLGVSYSVGIDGISLPMLFLTNIIGLASVFSSWNINKRPKEFFILLLLLIAGVTGTFIAMDLFIFLLFYELVVIPIYIMVIVWGSTKKVSKEYAGMKLTMYLLIGSAFMLVGIIALYLQAFPPGMRTFDIVALANAHFYGTLSQQFQIIVFLLMLLGFGTLLSMFPFHTWSPDGYAGAPTAVSMIHAGVLKKIGGYGLIRLGLLILPEGAKFWAPLIILLGLANVIYAAYIAIVQKDLKYVVGYSSVSHMGYVLLGFAALNTISLSGAVANMVAHGIMSALFFAMIGYVYEKTHMRSTEQLHGLAHQMPKIATGFMLAGMSSVGLPGLIGFIPEYTTFVGLFAKYPVLAIAAVSGIIFTSIYILRVLQKILFGPRDSRFDCYNDAKGAELVPLFLLSAVLILFGLFPQLLLAPINSGISPLGPFLDRLNAAPSLLFTLGGIW